ncbi:MAG: hypothetical protein WD768_23305 [Phycisphaeraceae bacterium]
MTLITDSSEPRSVADALGLGTLADSEPAMDPELLKQLYRYAHGDLGERAMFQNHHTFRSGWINLNHPEPLAIVSAFVPLDDEDDIRKARRIAQNNLKAQAWNDILGIESPPIRIEVKIHGREWGYRFIAPGSGRNGFELKNETLPPIPGDADRAERTGATPKTDHTGKSNETLGLEEAMKEAGLK